MKEPKPKSCKVCGKPFNPFKSTDKVCSYLCLVKQKELDEIEVRFKSIEAKVKECDSVKLLTKIAKQLVQKYARLRDKDLPCISCGSFQSIQFDGGHLFKSELYSGLRFDETNISKQCGKCNRYLSGNEVGYVQGFIGRYGLMAFNDLAQRAKDTKNKKWTAEELKKIIHTYKLKIKDNDT